MEATAPAPNAGQDASDDHVPRRSTGAEMITAGDVEKFAYCHLNFLRARQGDEGTGEELEAGTAAHAAAAEDLNKLKAGEDEVRQMELIVLVFAVVASILAVFAISFLPFGFRDPFGLLLSVIALIWLLAASVFLFLAENVPDPEVVPAYEKMIVASAIIATVIILLSLTSTFIENTQWTIVSLTVALVWLIGASVFFYRILRRIRWSRRKRGQLGVEGKIAYADSEVMKPPLLVAERAGLCGRPDLVLKRAGKHIPIELKTGRVPAGPHWSHIMQVVAYCRLIEEHYGSPPYGIIRYGDRDFPIEYTEDLRATLLSTLADMREVVRTSAAHRNHNRPGKCAGCSRREGCPERLDAPERSPRPGGPGRPAHAPSPSVPSAPRPTSQSPPPSAPLPRDPSRSPPSPHPARAA